MKERPILFSGEMVRAILNGTKTQTRRIMKLQPISCIKHSEPFLIMYGKENANRQEWTKRCPYGVPGDRLWVKETFRPFEDDEIGTCIQYRVDMTRRKPIWRGEQQGWKAEQDAMNIDHWKPSIFMQREFSRITLEVTGVRVEQVQDIGEADARAEGVSNLPRKLASHRELYYELWTKINGADSWEANPWVWVIEFKRRVAP